MVHSKEKQRLRELAIRKLELAESNRNQQLHMDWSAHGKTDASSRPMITVEFYSFSSEFIDPLLECESSAVRELEAMLLRDIFQAENIRDDTIVRDYIGFSEEYVIEPFGLAVRREETDGLGHHFISQIVSLTEDFHLLKKSPVLLNSADPRIAIAREAIDDILPVRKVGNPRICSPLQDILHIMSMTDMYVAMAQEADLFHKMFGMLTDDYISAIDKTEKEGLLAATNGDIHLCQGSMCYTSDLPKEGSALKTSQNWIYLDAQEAEGISPAMFHEFVFPYYKRISERFGLLSYGCCEAVHRFWDDISQFENLRKLSISPWCNEDFIADALSGRKICYHRKPTPNILGVDRYLDEDILRSNISKTVECTAGLTLEFSQRDIYTVHKDIGKVARYVEIIREECDKKK